MCVFTLYRMCEKEREHWGLVDEEFWCIQGHGPNEGLLNTQLGLQRCELTGLEVFWNQPQSEVVFHDTVDDWVSPPHVFVLLTVGGSSPALSKAEGWVADEARGCQFRQRNIHPDLPQPFDGGLRPTPHCHPWRGPQLDNPFLPPHPLSSDDI